MVLLVVVDARTAKWDELYEIIVVSVAVAVCCDFITAKHNNMEVADDCYIKTI